MSEEASKVLFPAYYFNLMSYLDLPLNQSTQKVVTETNILAHIGSAFSVV